MYSDHKMNKRRRCRAGNSRSAFSLIEIMVVVVIIGMLAGAVAVKVVGYVDTARINRAKSDIATISDAVEAYRLQNSSYPDNEQGLDVLPLKNRKDPWGQLYGYNSPAGSEPYEVYSYGADKLEGGEGVNSDIYSWQLGEGDGDDGQ